eukprot:11392191-Alexandrium_andersonii.AAC.1
MSGLHLLILILGKRCSFRIACCAHAQWLTGPRALAFIRAARQPASQPASQASHHCRAARPAAPFPVRERFVGRAGHGLTA